MESVKLSLSPSQETNAPQFMVFVLYKLGELLQYSGHIKNNLGVRASFTNIAKVMIDINLDSKGIES